MSITSRINEMSSHIEQAYDELQGLGADLTNVNKNIENISMVLDDIYDSMPQVSGEGTSLTLDDTRIGKIKSTLKGNTSQTGTPTPSSPIPVNVVSGDNEINVVGKNLYNAKNTNSIQGGLTYTVNDNGTFNISGTASSVVYFTNDKNVSESNFVNGNSYTLSSNKTIPSGVSYKIEIRSATSWLREYLISNSTPTRTFTIDLTNAEIIRYVIQVNNGITPNLSNVGVQLELGSSATSYEPYQGNTYNIDLPVENLFEGVFEEGGWDIVNGQKQYALGRNRCPDLIAVNPSTTYTISFENAGTCYVLEYGSNSNYLSYSQVSYRTYNGSFTTNANTRYITFYYIPYNHDFTLNEECQLEQGSKANTFTPYGTTPIELCKIGNYQDYFGKSDGRNLFDISTITEGKYIDASGGLQNTSNSNTSDYILVSANESYTLSWNYTLPFNSTSRREIVLYNTSKTFVKTITLVQMELGELTFTPSQSGYIRFDYDKKCFDIQLEEGSSATNPQPFGIGKWYLHKEIGKVVLDGTQTITINSSSASRTVFEVNNITNLKDYATLEEQGDSPNILCPKFNQVSQNASWASGDISKKRLNQNKVFIIWEANKTIAELETLTTNMPIYYVLATSTNTEITYQPLIDQLNLLEKAMSKDGQTNISQVNNDLPFIISASALKEWQESTSLNSTLSMVNPLSLGNTLNTQDTTQPIEVDNIEPLEEEENEES